jgi:hypothetical protein
VFYGALFRHAHGDHHSRSFVARVVAHPLGRVVVIGVGVGLLVYGVVELVQAVRGSFVHDFDGKALKRATRRALSAVGRVGLAVRGVLFGAAGVLLVRSAWRARADTVSTGDVLRRLAASSFGVPVMAVLSVGLFAYAGLMFAEACWRHMNPRDR